MSHDDPTNASGADTQLAALRTLDSIEPPRDLSDRVRRHAHAELEAGDATWLTVVTRAWLRVGVPAGLTVTVVAYLAWAVTQADALYH
ncbi:MAG TPA: hypothetical protein VIY73_19085 [Polyangiaceae bacterium]